MELDDLVGEHVLTGVDEGVGPREDYDEDSNTISFVLDGVTYTASEDPSDGYRSCMRAIKVGGEVKNTFPPCRVLASMAERGSDDNDILELRDITTGKVILRVGTANSSDYYPWWVAEWRPQLMAVNADKKP